LKVVNRIGGVIVPTAQARIRHWPIDASGVRLVGGLLGERQRTNRDVTLRCGHEELERAGTLDNFRIAAGRAEGTRRGMVFSDSDVYKWLEALAWELGREPSAELEQLTAETVELVAAAQEPDGYLNTYGQLAGADWRWSDLTMGHELYCGGHLMQAGIALSRATGDDTLLGVATRFADLVDDEFRGGAQHGTDGHPEVEAALVELYRHTSERRYLELADALTSRRGSGLFAGHHFGLPYFQDVEPVRGSRSIVGHAVRALYLAAGATDIYAETGDEELLDAMLAQWRDMTSDKTYLTGGVGSRHHGEAIGDAYELPPDRAYCETCAAIASIMWSWRLLLITGESRFADLIERTLFNGFLAGMSLDGRSFFYDNPLQVRTGHVRHRWNPVACCPPNIMRLLSSINQYVATTSASGVELHQYAPAVIRAVGPDGEPIGLAVKTQYPWAARVTIEITEGGPSEWTLALRIPAWARSATVDGRPVEAGGYARLTRRFATGDLVELELDVAPRLTAPNPLIDAVRGCLAIERGPLVYCIEQADQPDTELARVLLDPDAACTDTGPLADLNGAIGLTTQGRLAELDGWAGVAYRDRRDSPELGGPPATIMAIPYFACSNREIGTMRVWIPEAVRRPS
jgi:uncharacterized protein